MIFPSSEAAVAEVAEESKVDEVVDASELVSLLLLFFEDLFRFGVCKRMALIQRSEKWL